MSGADIAAEVFAALGEVADDAGDGDFTVTFISPAPLPENPWDAPDGEPTQFELRAFVEAFRQEQVDDTLIFAGDRKVMVDALGEVPTTADRVILPEGEFAILSVEPLSPAGVPLYYQLHCRR